MSSIKPAQIYNALQTQLCCVICASTQDLTVDHVYPKSLGGANHLANYQIMCRTHNESKKNYIDYTFDYIESISSKHILSELFSPKNKNKKFSPNYKKALVKKCFGKSLSGQELLCVTEYNSAVVYFALYGLKLNPKPEFNIVVNRANFFIKTDPDYALSKHRILEYINKTFKL